MDLARTLALVYLASACSGPVEAVRTSAPEDDAWRVAYIPPWFLDTEGLERVLDRDAAGEMFVVERFRFHAGDGRTVVADDTPQAPIVGVAHAEECWLFATSDGAIFRAPSFTGPLTPIGSAGAELTEPASSTRSEVLLVRSADAVWTARCDGALQRLDLPGVIGGAWASPEHGVIVREPGEILRSRADGWEHVAMLPDTYAGVSVDGARVVIRTRTAALAIDAAGTPAPIEAADDGPRESDRLYADPDNAVRTTLELARWERGAFLDDGTIAVTSPGAVHHRGPDGSSGRMRLPPHVRECAVRPAGAELFLLCEGEGDQSGLATAFHARAGSSWQAVALPRQPMRSEWDQHVAIVTSSEGFVLSAWGDMPALWYDGHEVRARQLDGIVRGLQGDLVLVRREGGLFAARLSQAEAPALSGLAIDAIDGVFAGADVVALVRRPDETLALATGTVDDLMVGARVPPGTSSIEFADRRHGIALGESQAFATSDGGAHWEALPGEHHGHVYCDPSACRAGHALFADPRVLATLPALHRMRGEGRPEPLRDPDRERPPEPPSPPWICSFDEAETQALEERIAARDAELWPSAVHHGWLEPLGPDRVLRWAGRDVRGTFRVAARALESEIADEPAWTHALWLTRERAVVQRCVVRRPPLGVIHFAPAFRGCDIFIAEPNRSPVHVSSSALGDSIATASLVLADGSVALMSNAYLLLHVGRDGTILGRRAMSWVRYREGATLIADRDGLALADGSTRYALDPSRAPVEMATLGALPPCGRSTADATMLVDTLVVELRLGEDRTNAQGHLLARVELGRDGACWREAIQLEDRPSDVLRSSLPGTLRLYAENGRPVAEVIAPEGRVRATCAPR